MEFGKSFKSIEILVSKYDLLIKSCPKRLYTSTFFIKSEAFIVKKELTGFG